MTRKCFDCDKEFGSEEENIEGNGTNTCNELYMYTSDDEKHEKIKFGDEEYQGQSVNTHEPCYDCGVKAGSPHHCPCAIEECPVCHYWRNTCDCEIDFTDQDIVMIAMDLVSELCPATGSHPDGSDKLCMECMDRAVEFVADVKYGTHENVVSDDEAFSEMHEHHHEHDEDADDDDSDPYDEFIKCKQCKKNLMPDKSLEVHLCKHHRQHVPNCDCCDNPASILIVPPDLNTRGESGKFSHGVEK